LLPPVLLLLLDDDALYGDDDDPFYNLNQYYALAFNREPKTTYPIIYGTPILRVNHEDEDDDGDSHGDDGEH